MAHSYHPLRDSGSRKNVRPNSWGKLLWNSIFWTWHGRCTHEFRAACTRLGWLRLHNTQGGTHCRQDRGNHALVNHNPLLQAPMIKHDVSSCTQKDPKVGRGSEGGKGFQWKKKRDKRLWWGMKITKIQWMSIWNGQINKWDENEKTEECFQSLLHSKLISCLVTKLQDGTG